MEIEKHPGAGIPADWHPGDKINLDPFIPEPKRNTGDQAQANGSINQPRSIIGSNARSQSSNRSVRSEQTLKTTITMK